MSNIVDLSNLHDICDGDKEMERELFADYISSSQELIMNLEKFSKSEVQSYEWRSASHALKGISENLGAFRFANLCKLAQESFDKDTVFKNNLFVEIKSEHEEVLAFLNSHMTEH